MAVTLNPAAVTLAEQLLETGNYRINSVWREARPSEAATEDYLDRKGYDSLAQWYFGMDTDAEQGTTDSLRFPIGDFKTVHRSAIVAARDEANRIGAADIAEAADELIFYFDRITAC